MIEQPITPLTRAASSYSSELSDIPLVSGEVRDEYERLFLERDGWSIRGYRYFLDDGRTYDNRTVGLPEHFNHLNLQLYVSLEGSRPSSILAAAVDLIKQGKSFKHGDTSTDLLDGLTVMFVSAKVHDREFLRIILPDNQGQYREGEIAEPFARQYANLDGIRLPKVS